MVIQDEKLSFVRIEKDREEATEDIESEMFLDGHYEAIVCIVCQHDCD